MKNSHIITLLIATVFILVVAMQVTIYNSLSSQMEDISVVNYSGRQRMLSQNIAKTAQKIQIAYNENRTFKEERLELKKITDEFIEGHEKLVKGHQGTGVAVEKSVTIERMLEEVTPMYEVLSTNALQLAVENKEQDIENIFDAIVTTEASFLIQMDAIVNQYELEAQQKKAKLQRLIVMLGVLSFLIFISVLFFVLRPYLRTITNKNVELALNNKTLSTKYREFDAAKIQTETKNRQLQRKNEIYTKKAVTLEEELIRLKEENAIHKYLLDEHTRYQLSALRTHRDFVSHLENEKNHDIKAIESLKKSLTHQHLMIDKTNEYLSLSQGKIETNTLPFDIKKVIEELRDLLSTKAKENKVDFQINSSAELPDTIIGDENYLGKALFLLLDNAVKSYGEKVSFDVFLNHVNENHQAHIDFAISDSSRYILEENFDELFNLTHPANAEKLPYNKLDIAIAHELLKLMGSHIRIDSSEDSGTTFYFSLTLPIESPVAENYYKIR